MTAVGGPVAIAFAGPRLIEPIAGLLAAACGPTAIASYLFPHDNRAERLHAMMVDLVTDTLGRGRVRIACRGPVIAGAALWMPCPQRHGVMLAASTGTCHNPRLDSLNQAVAARHLPGPHGHLRYVAVHPRRHGENIATQLITDGAAGARADQYTLAPDPRTQQWLTRLGYQPRGPVINLPRRGGPHLQPMVRPWRRPSALARPASTHRPAAAGSGAS